MNDEERMKSIETAAQNLPRQSPGIEVDLKILETVHRMGREPTRTEFGPVMDMDELAEYLRVDRATIEIHLDEIPCFELGGRLLFRRKSIEDWIQEKEWSFATQSRAAVQNEAMFRQTDRWGGARWQISHKN
jgi:hypothetical protein